jgi:undecaprenyl-diphosphatase
VTVAATATVAALLPKVLDRTLQRRLPPVERHDPSKQSYPSGHALQASAMALTTGYVLYREGVGPRWLGAPLGLAALGAGAGRLLLDRHWTSDVIGGYCAGVALGAAAAGLYERAS